MEASAEFGRLAMFPLQSAFLPGEDLPLQIFEPRYAELVRHCMRDNNPRFGVVLISQGREVGGGDVRCDVGTVAMITECVEIAGSGRFMLRCRTSERIKVCEWLPDGPYPRAVVEVWPDEPEIRCRPPSSTARRPDDGAVRADREGARFELPDREVLGYHRAGARRKGFSRWPLAFRLARPTAIPCSPRRERPSGWWR